MEQRRPSFFRASTSKPTVASLPLAVLALTLTVLLPAPAAACPDFCSCFNRMASCSDFRVLDLAMLPAETDTLVLSRAELDEVPPAFLARARGLRVVEILSVSARVVRGGAFRGISNLDFFAISNCTFDIVEPEGLSGLNNVEKVHISESNFGRVGKHGFAEISSVLEFRLWNNKFEYISDEAFYKLTDTLSIQMFQNSIQYLGANIFKDAVEVDDVNIFSNYIRTAEESCLDNLPSVAYRMVFYNNEFECSCSLVWMLGTEHWKEQNKCTFPGGEGSTESTFRVVDLPESVMCVKKTSTTSSPPTPAYTEEGRDAFRELLNDTNNSNYTTQFDSPNVDAQNASESQEVKKYKHGEESTDSGETEIFEFVDFVEVYPVKEYDEEYNTPKKVPMSSTQSVPVDPQDKADSTSTVLKKDEIFVVEEIVVQEQKGGGRHVGDNDNVDEAVNPEGEEEKDDIGDKQEISTDVDSHGTFNAKPNQTEDASSRNETDFPAMPQEETSTELPLSDVEDADVIEDAEEDDMSAKIAPVLSGGEDQREPAKPYATSAVEMETATPESSATTQHGHTTLTSFFTASLVLAATLKRFLC